MVGGSNPPSATSLELASWLAEGAARTEIPNRVPLVLAVSGGPDSTALLHAAVALARARDWQLVVAHLDHGLRQESGDDARFVTDAADALGLPWRLRRTDVAAQARQEGSGVEEAGRIARYAFLDEVADSLGPDALVVTAHTADDQAETVLLNLARGSGQRGLRGMPDRRGRVVRPLLHVRRSALRAALDAAGIEYRLDPTNADTERSRARVRVELLPALERLNPAAVEALLRFAELAADDDALLDALAAEELARRRDADGAIDWRRPPPRALGSRVLRLAIGDPAPAADRIEALLAAASGPRGGLVIELGRGRKATVRGRRIRIGP
ncbi:MAG TPA: tRNA lysidine(34) synthetase TilS [Pleomorphomonadaceae bacterium]|nr:tRNA lysidine(34) synthetase TilS [Pleomorphomonadaceae bacterium]